MIIVPSSFSKTFVFKMLSVHAKASVFKFLLFEERFLKASFSLRIIVDGRPNRRNKAAFSNSSGFRYVLLWTVSPTVERNLRFQISRRSVHGALD